jgi:hypothetical protein
VNKNDTIAELGSLENMTSPGGKLLGPINGFYNSKLDKICKMWMTNKNVL